MEQNDKRKLLDGLIMISDISVVDTKRLACDGGQGSEFRVSINGTDYLITAQRVSDEQIAEEENEARRQVQVTFTHETCGDGWFGPMMAEAFAEYSRKVNAGRWNMLNKKALSADAIMNDMADYRASNGVLIQVHVPGYVNWEMLTIEQGFGSPEREDLMKDLAASPRDYSGLTDSELAALIEVRQ